MFICRVEFTIRATYCGLAQAEKQQRRQFNEICRIHIYIRKESRKWEEQMMRKMANGQKKQNP